MPSTASATNTPTATTLPVRSSESDDVEGTRNTGPGRARLSSNWIMLGPIRRPGLPGASMRERSVVTLVMATLLLFGNASRSRAQTPDGAAIFQKNCVSCHTGAADTRAPAPDVLRQRSPEAILSALTAGSMRPQGGILSGAERRA